VRIQEDNSAAAGFLLVQRSAILKHRGGEVLHCLNSTDVPEGCGRAPFCEECVIRNSVFVLSARKCATTKNHGFVSKPISKNIGTSTFLMAFVRNATRSR
jgi:hypothetical protein